MIKLVYDLKAGFEDCYLTIKDEEYDLSFDIGVQPLGTVEFLEDIEAETGEPVDLEALRQADFEKEFYEDFHDDSDALLTELENNGTFDMLYEDSVLSISKTFFAHLLGGERIKHIVPVWEPSNFRLVYDLDTRSDFYYEDGLKAGEVFEYLGINKQQLYYYVKTGQVKKEYSRRDPKKFTYNRLDCEVLKKKLCKKR